MASRIAVALTAVLLATQAPGIAVQEGAGSPTTLTIRALSTHADRVSGGDVLVEVVLPASNADAQVAIALNGADVSSAFRRGGTPHSRVGLVTGLTTGRNRLTADARGLSRASLDVINYPSDGPIISGPHVQPFVCQTNDFKMPDGTTLGAPLDANCSIRTRVDYVYMPAGGSEFRMLRDTTSLPADVATATTTSGARVPFIVRLETGSMNRGIYQNVVLHDPTRDPQPTPFTPPPAWNRRLIALHGSGCPGGWYRQGAAMGVSPLNATRLGEGYALFVNTLNHPSNSCNAIVAGETTMMGKEHFIETFGMPAFTVSMGGSGGAYTSLQVGDAFPGLFDGVVITSTFPDALSIAMAGLDGHLLTHYLQGVPAESLTEQQIIAISGYSGLRALIDAANQGQRTDPVPGRQDIERYSSAVWNAAVPESLRYHPTANPRGARPTVFDWARNIYGIDAKTGFALRPFDNVGVQYGLKALKDGAITTAQFLDLNERIGGYDQDANYVAARSVGDAGAIKRAYQSGITLSGGGGLANIPVFDAGGYNDTSGYHYAWFHFAVRERMRKASGHADNHLLWRGPVPARESWKVLMDWVAAIKADASSASPREKMQRNRPADAVDGCWTAAAEGATQRFIREPQTFTAEKNSACNELYPSYSFTRQAAGGPLDANVLKCQLRPIDVKDYAPATFSPEQAAKLRQIFPGGVCDWSKPGVNQVPVVTWASFGPAPDNLVFDVTKR